MNARSQKWLAGVCGLLAAAGAHAQQIDVGLTLAYSAFVVGEPVVVQVALQNGMRDRITVDGGGGASPTLFFEITKGGEYDEVIPFSTEPFVRGVQLNPGQSFQRTLALDKRFSLMAEGKYIVRAVVAYKGMRYESVKRSFDVVPGLSVGGGVQMFVASEQVRRQFKLVYWHRNQADRLFLRIEDDPGARIWDSVDLGALMRDFPPKIDIAPDGEVTVLHRATKDAFLRTVLWSLPDAVEVVERNELVDPDISAAQRVNALYGEDADNADKAKKAWWKFW
jgi:hypothetical protein